MKIPWLLIACVLLAGCGQPALRGTSCATTATANATAVTSITSSSTAPPCDALGNLTAVRSNLLDLLDCQYNILLFPADESKVQQELPNGYTTPGNGAKTLAAMDLYSCGKGVVGNRTVMSAFHLLIVEATIHPPASEDNSTTDGYALEILTDSTGLRAAFEASGFLVGPATFSWAGDPPAIDVSAGATHYMAQLSTVPGQNSHTDVVVSRVHQAPTKPEWADATEDRNQLPNQGFVLQVTGGVVSRIAYGPTPLSGIAAFNTGSESLEFKEKEL